ncbi:hypothetical protein GCM10014719_50510 [Planomonospora parontospora subsp. antibiotica]|nr:hypothetical protein GCM10014719_50510 [Planomonospora parontospora subsp. antibiotica]GII18528.1 hypothetical protein Ppa05_52540 [Planomonospora parontospora subsp. antibiotica]
MFTEVGGTGCGGGAVAAAQPPPGVETGWGVEADAGAEAVADTVQAVTRTAAQKVLIMAASMAGGRLHGRERNR